MRATSLVGLRGGDVLKDKNFKMPRRNCSEQEEARCHLFVLRSKKIHSRNAEHGSEPGSSSLPLFEFRESWAVSSAGRGRIPQLSSAHTEPFARARILRVARLELLTPWKSIGGRSDQSVSIWGRKHQFPCSTSNRATTNPKPAPRNTSDGKCDAVVIREKLMAEATVYARIGTHLCFA